MSTSAKELIRHAILKGSAKDMHDTIQGWLNGELTTDEAHQRAQIIAPAKSPEPEPIKQT